MDGVQWAPSISLFSVARYGSRKSIEGDKKYRKITEYPEYLFKCSRSNLPLVWMLRKGGKEKKIFASKVALDFTHSTAGLRDSLQAAICSLFLSLEKINSTQITIMFMYSISLTAHGVRSFEFFFPSFNFFPPLFFDELFCSLTPYFGVASCLQLALFNMGSRLSVSTVCVDFYRQENIFLDCEEIKKRFRNLLCARWTETFLLSPSHSLSRLHATINHSNQFIQLEHSTHQSKSLDWNRNHIVSSFHRGQSVWREGNPNLISKLYRKVHRKGLFVVNGTARHVTSHRGCSHLPSWARVTPQKGANRIYASFERSRTPIN